MDAGTTHKGKVGRLRVKSLHFKFYSAIQFDVFSLAYLYRGGYYHVFKESIQPFFHAPQEDGNPQQPESTTRITENITTITDALYTVPVYFYLCPESRISPLQGRALPEMKRIQTRNMMTKQATRFL